MRFPAAGSSSCPPGQFPCLDSVGCVDASARCDGRRQCPTGSDEENCTASEGCLDSDWMCRNRICIPKELRCNGLNDCLDNSDEQDCGEERRDLTYAGYWMAEMTNMDKFVSSQVRVVKTVCDVQRANVRLLQRGATGRFTAQMAVMNP